MNKSMILINLSESEQTRFGKEDFHIQSVHQKVFLGAGIRGQQRRFFSVFSEQQQKPRPSLLKQFAESMLRALPGYAIMLPANPEAISSAAENLADDRLDELEVLDGEFMKYPHDFAELLFAYVSRHPEDLGQSHSPTDFSLAIVSSQPSAKQPKSALSSSLSARTAIEYGICCLPLRKSH
jgi:hypothetical protein